MASDTDVYVTKNLSNQWLSAVESDSLQANLNLTIDENNYYSVQLKDLNVEN